MERFKIVLLFCDINSLHCASAVWINHLHLQTAKYSAILTCVHVKGATSIEKYRKTWIQRLQALEATLCVTRIHISLAGLKTLNYFPHPPLEKLVDCRNPSWDGTDPNCCCCIFLEGRGWLGNVLGHKS